MKTIGDNLVELKIIDIFVSSPSDVAEERMILDEVINDLNHIWMDSLKIMFRSKKWENDVYSKVQNKNPNDIIIDEIADYDIYLGIMWKYFGTPTEEYKSGTEQEFRIALKNYEEKNRPDIKFYFSKRKFETDDIDIEQLTNVKEFEDELKTKGILKYYDSLEKFRYILFKELSECLKDEYNRLNEME